MRGGGRRGDGAVTRPGDGSSFPEAPLGFPAAPLGFPDRPARGEPVEPSVGE